MKRVTVKTDFNQMKDIHLDDHSNYEKTDIFTKKAITKKWEERRGRKRNLRISLAL